jgi:hypothetical protein
MKRITPAAAAAAAALALLLALPSTAPAQSPLAAAIAGGKASANLRLRFESVDDDAVARKGEALTLRTRLGYETASFEGFSVQAEFEDVRTPFGIDDYAPESSAIPPYATILDRRVTELNRAELRYRGVPGLDLGYGRQRIAYDNQRFIGNIGWRQDEQTFDGFTAVYTGVKDFIFSYAHLTGVNGVDETLDSDDIGDDLFNVAYSGFGWGRLSAYAYLLDHGDETDAALNPGVRFRRSDSVGLRFDGSRAFGALKLLYTAEYAAQEYEDSTGTLKASPDYRFAEIGAGYTLAAAQLTLKIAREALGSDGGRYGFQTPHGTRHAFNGWADKFLATPAAGLVDRFATLAVALPAHAVNLLAVYHDYRADRGGGDFGSEWNLQAVKAFGPHYTLGIKYAAYDGRDLPYRDTDKYWLWGEINF